MPTTGKQRKREQEPGMVEDTIFSPSFGNRPSYLVGREAILRSFDQNLQTRPGSRERSTVLLGQRGSGKTVLLWELADRARKCGYVVANPTVTSEGMLDRIVEKIQKDGERYVKENHKRLAGGSVGALGFSVGLQFTKDVQETKSAEYKLTQLAERLTAEGHGILILVDELQANSADVRKLVIAYQEIVGEGLDIAMVLAGLPAAVSATLNDRVLTFLNRSNKVVLPSLALGDIDAFYSRAFASIGLKVNDVLRRKAVEATAGSPYMLQLVGHYMAVYAQDDGTAEEQQVDQAILAARHDFQTDVCETTLAALSDKDAEFLIAMSQDASESRISEVAERMSVSVDYAQKYRRRLIDAGVIRASGRGRVSFAVPYLADYLRKEESV